MIATITLAGLALLWDALEAHPASLARLVVGVQPPAALPANLDLEYGIQEQSVSVYHVHNIL